MKVSSRNSRCFCIFDPLECCCLCYITTKTLLSTFSEFQETLILRKLNRDCLRVALSCKEKYPTSQSILDMRDVGKDVLIDDNGLCCGALCEINFSRHFCVCSLNSVKIPYRQYIAMETKRRSSPNKCRDHALPKIGLTNFLY